MHTIFNSFASMFWLLCLSVGATYGQSTVLRQSPNQIINRINDVAMEANGRGVAVGSSGLVLVSADFGASWASIPQVVQNSNRVVTIPDGAGLQFLCLSFGQIYRSTDGGSSWLAASLPAGLEVGSLNRFATPSAQALYASSSVAVLKSINGGVDWTDITPVVAGNPNWITISFVDDLTGWVSNNLGHIYHTTDGGVTWIAQDTTSFTQAALVHFTSTQMGYAAVFRDLYRTTDGGQSWELWGPNAFPTHQQQLHTLDGQHLVASQNGLIINVSEDGGQNWTRRRPTSYGGDYTHFTGMADGRLWLGGQHGTIAYSNDYGQTFVDQLPGFKFPLNSISFADEFVGWCVGEAGAVTRTANGGATWTTVETLIAEGSPAEPPYFFLAQAYAHHEAVLCSRGGVYRTTDGGQTWQRTIESGANFFETAHARGDKVVVLSSQARAYVSEDRGQTWTDYAISSNASLLLFVHVVNQQVAFAGGGGATGQLFKTIDGGISWTELAAPSIDRVLGGWFLNEQEGWLLVDAFTNQFYHTTDGGQSWEQLTLPQSSYWRAAHVTSSGELDVLGGSSGIALAYRTTDGGQSWTNWLSSFEFSFGNYAYQDLPSGHSYWICGGSGSILRADFIEAGTREAGVLPLTVGPNPFSDQVYLQLPTGVKEGEGILSCYDQLGRLVHRTAACQALSLAHLSAGVYVLTLQYGRQTWAGRLVKD